MYDSHPDTVKHIIEVGRLILRAVEALKERAAAHDRSKLSPPEKPVFDEMTPLLAESTFGSPEYAELLKRLKPALDHHYANNRHHPEFHRNGVEGMTLIDLIEMLCDWKAATLRHNDGNTWKSLEINTARFKIPEPLVKVLRNTVEEMGW